MSDTILPFKTFIQQEESNLFYFRGALLPTYRQALDELFIHAELMIAAITMAEDLPRSEALQLGMLVGLCRDLLAMQHQMRALEGI